MRAAKAIFLIPSFLVSESLLNIDRVIRSKIETIRTRDVYVSSVSGLIDGVVWKNLRFNANEIRYVRPLHKLKVEEYGSRRLWSWQPSNVPTREGIVIASDELHQAISIFEGIFFYTQLFIHPSSLIRVRTFERVGSNYTRVYVYETINFSNSSHGSVGQLRTSPWEPFSSRWGNTDAHA